MKLRYSLLLLASFLLHKSVSAQLVGSSVYLQGAFVEIGVAANGSFGAGATPAGYHPRTSGGAPGSIGSNLSMVYDYGHDGWAVGTPGFWGDYTFPGTPFEGWAMQANGVRSDAFYTLGAMDGMSFWNATGGTLTGLNTAYSNSPVTLPCGSTSYGRPVTGVWTGTAGPAGSGPGGAGVIQIRQSTIIDTGASWVYVNTVFKNTSTSAVPGVYYWRTCDPDNAVTQTSGAYSTNNSITYQNDAIHRVEVGSYGNPIATYSGAYLSMATKDCRAKAMIYSAWSPYPSEAAGNNLDQIYNGTATGLGTTFYNQGDVTVSQDWGMGLIYNLGTLPAGDSAMISYAYIFKDSTCIDSVFPEPRLVVNCVPKAPSGPAPAPTFDTFSKCNNPGVAILPVSVAHGDSRCWSWSRWTWAPGTGLSTTTGISNTINLAAVTTVTTYTITGTDSAYGMGTCANRVFYLTIIPGCVSATNNGPICAGDSLKLNAPGDSLGATYYWYGPTGFAGVGQSTFRYPTTALDSGNYYVVRTVGGVPDTGITHVVIKPRPVINLTSNAPICSGKTLTITATPDSVGEIWSTSGPAGYTGSAAIITRPSAFTTYSGTYWFRATLRGCRDSNFINVVVDSTPATPVTGSNSPVCSQYPMFLTAASATTGVSYSWTGPGSYTSTAQNPTVTSANVSHSGVYSVLVTLGSCTSTATVTVVVDSTPLTPTLTSNSPVCSGNPLNFTALSSAGSSYNWSGPSGFTSAVQNPVINPAFTLNSGTYTVTASTTSASGHTCTSLPAIIPVVVDSTPVAPTASSNSPGPPGVSICEGDTLMLYANHVTPGVTYAWSGPNSFTSTQQNPVIYNALPTASGVYTVVTNIGACSSSVSITVSVTPTPPLVASSNSPSCSGDTLKLFATSLPGATYAWQGPYTYFAYVQNPFRTPSVVEQSGVYTVIATANGCTAMVRDTVVVNQTPNPPVVRDLVLCQYFDGKALQPGGVNLLWYPSAAAGSVGSPVAPVPNTAIAPASYWYFVSQTVAGCTSKIDSVQVTINPKPTVTARGPVAICPRDSVWLWAQSTDPNVTLRWSPSTYLEGATGAVAVSRPESSLQYRIIAGNLYHCDDTAYIDVTVRPRAVMYMPDSVTIWPGESYHIQPQSNCSIFRWFPSYGLSSALISDPVAKPEASIRYVLTGETEWGCISADTILIKVETEPVLGIPNAFHPGGGVNDVFKVLKRGAVELESFRIYDRWGVVVFETTDINQGWDGTYNGRPQPMGVYVYSVTAHTKDGVPISKAGNVTLLR